MTAKKNSRLVEELKSLVEGHLKKHPNLTIHGLSKRCGVASSTLRRILAQETKEDPNPNTVLGILSAITKEKDIQKLRGMFGGELQASLERSYAFVHKFSYRPELSDVLDNREAYIIYKLAANAVGTCRRDITDLLGLPAEEKVDELLKYELIYEVEGRLHAKEKNFFLPENISKKHVSELLRYTESEGAIGAEHSIFQNWSESITEDAMAKIKEVLGQANREIGQILSRADSIGEVPFFYTCILDTMAVNRPEKKDYTSSGRKVPVASESPSVEIQ